MPLPELIRGRFCRTHQQLELNPLNKECAIAIMDPFGETCNLVNCTVELEG